MGMQVANNTGPSVRPGPVPTFTKKLKVWVRPDQDAALGRIARALGMTVSDVVRMFLDTGIDAVEQTPSYRTISKETAK